MQVTLQVTLWLEIPSCALRGSFGWPGIIRCRKCGLCFIIFPPCGWTVVAAEEDKSKSQRRSETAELRSSEKVQEAICTPQSGLPAARPFHLFHWSLKPVFPCDGGGSSVIPPIAGYQMSSHHPSKAGCWFHMDKIT